MGLGSHCRWKGPLGLCRFQGACRATTDSPSRRADAMKAKVNYSDLQVRLGFNTTCQLQDDQLIQWFSRSWVLSIHMKTWSKNTTHWPPSPCPVGNSYFQGSSRPTGHGAQGQMSTHLVTSSRQSPERAGLGASGKASCVLPQTQPPDNTAPRRMQPCEEQAKPGQVLPTRVSGAVLELYCLPESDACLGHRAVPEQRGPVPGQHP